MNISGDYLVGTMKRYEDPVEIPIVEHPEADENWISFQGRDMKQFKFIGISVDYRDLTLVDFDPDNITEDDVTVYHAHSAHVKENGDLCSHATVEGETNCVDGFLAAVNEEKLPLNEPLRVGDLEGHVGHVLDALTSEIGRNYLGTYQLGRGDIPDGVEFQLNSYSTWNPEVEVLDLGGLAREQLERDFEDFPDVYSRSELTADEFRSLVGTVGKQAVTDEDRRCAELIGCNLETKQVTICTPSEFFDRMFQEYAESITKDDLHEDELRKKARECALRRIPKEETFEVLCGVNWNGH